MELKDILLLIDPAAPNGARLAVAADLSRAHAAAVRGLCLYQIPPPSLAEGYALGARAVAAVCAREADAVQALLAPAHQAFLKALRHAEWPAVWEPRAVTWVEAALARTVTADLAIVGCAPAASDRWRDVVESLVLCGGTPVLVAPERVAPAPRFRHAVVGWNGSRESKRALDDAMVLLKTCAQTDLVVVEGRGGPIDCDLSSLIGHLERHGITAAAWRIKARDEGVAAALRRHCEHRRADLLVLGAYSHSRAGEQIFGGVTRSLLRDPPVATFVSH